MFAPLLFCCCCSSAKTIARFQCPHACFFRYYRRGSLSRAEAGCNMRFWLPPCGLNCSCSLSIRHTRVGWWAGGALSGVLFTSCFADPLPSLGCQAAANRRSPFKHWPTRPSLVFFLSFFLLLLCTFFCALRFVFAGCDFFELVQNRRLPRSRHGQGHHVHLPPTYERKGIMTAQCEFSPPPPQSSCKTWYSKRGRYR